MVNPVKELRDRTGWDRRRFAVATGLDYNDIYRAEHGYPSKLPRRMARQLANHAGIIESDVQQQYQSWRQQQREALLEQVGA